MNETIIYFVNSFSSVIACYSVKLDKQFFLTLLEYFPAKMAQSGSPARKIGQYAYVNNIGITKVVCRNVGVIL